MRFLNAVALSVSLVRCHVGSALPVRVPPVARPAG